MAETSAANTNRLSLKLPPMASGANRNGRGFSGAPAWDAPAGILQRDCANFAFVLPRRDGHPRIGVLRRGGECIDYDPSRDRFAGADGRPPRRGAGWPGTRDGGTALGPGFHLRAAEGRVAR